MKRLLHTRMPVLLTLALTLASLSFTATAPATHAASPPSIRVYGQGGGVRVFGSGYNSGATVQIEIFDMGLTKLQALLLVKASSGTYPGQFSALVNTSYVGDVRIAADGAPGPTAWATTHVYAAPHVEAYGESGAAEISASGFTPGASVRVEVLDSNLHLLSTEYDTAYVGLDAINDGSFIAYPTSNGYVGWVWIALDGSPGPTAWARTYVSR